MRPSLLLVRSWLLLRSCWSNGVSAADADNNNNNHNSCDFVMAESTIPNSGFGVFALVDRNVNDPVLTGEPVIQLPDSSFSSSPDGLEFLLQSYAWEAQQTGGQDEGLETVQSIIPGLSMLANTGFAHNYNVGAAQPRIDHADLVRGQHVGAGSVTHYQDLRHHVKRPLLAGEEVLVHYGSNYWKQFNDDDDHKVPPTYHRSVEWLRKHGMCLDNLKAAPSPGRGRGAVATRALPAGTVVAPVPVVALNRTSLAMTGGGGGERSINAHQLLLNYVYSHVDSSIALFPYSPAVNLINRDDRRRQPNVKLQWSSKMKHPDEWFHKTAAQVLETHESGLLLELVATREIAPNEEVLLDYGDEWHAAWIRHEQTYMENIDKYYDNHAYATHMNRASRIRTLSEQQEYPYPPNLVTSCFYIYGMLNEQQQQQHVVDADGTTITTRSVWTHHPHVFYSQYLRPCHVLERKSTPRRSADDTITMETTYTVDLLNHRHHKNTMLLFPEETIADGHRHVVSGVPRQAISFTDVPYSTDQHLPYAFRHWIGGLQHCFPIAWMDLRDTR